MLGGMAPDKGRRAMSLTRFCDRCKAADASEGMQLHLKLRNTRIGDIPPIARISHLDLCEGCRRELIAEIEEWWDPESVIRDGRAH